MAWGILAKGEAGKPNSAGAEREGGASIFSATNLFDLGDAAFKIAVLNVGQMQAARCSQNKRSR